VRLRYGRIPYVNVAPIETAFDAGALARDVEIVVGVPTALNAALAEGAIDVAPISAAHYLRHRERYAPLADLCIAADGPVRSVVLAAPRPPHLLGEAEIAVTRDSASGRALLETILRRFPAVRARYAVVDDALAAARAGQATLLIGDDALSARAELAPAQVYDLGEAWREWTGLPFVFAIWSVRRELLERAPADVAALAGALVAARAWGEEHRAAVIDAAVAQRPGHRALYDDYFIRLSYTLGDRARRGLEHFASLLPAEEELRAAG
jgi:chorismate dehydratase